MLASEFMSKRVLMVQTHLRTGMRGVGVACRK